MEIKKIEQTPVIRFSVRTSLKELNNYTFVVPEALKQKAEELGIATNKPQIWQYTGSDGNPNTEFLLQICVPISKIQGNAGNFEFATIPAHTFISHIHKGPWNLLGNTYKMLVDEIVSKKLRYTNITRELYVNCDFENQENCITEVQVVLE